MLHWNGGWGGGGGGVSVKFLTSGKILKVKYTGTRNSHLWGEFCRQMPLVRPVRDAKKCISERLFSFDINVVRSLC